MHRAEDARIKAKREAERLRAAKLAAKQHA